MKRVADFLDISVEWTDGTPYGSTLSGRLQDFVAGSLYPETTQAVAALMLDPARRAERLSVRETADSVLRERRSEPHQAVLADTSFWHPKEDDIAPAWAHLRSTVGTGLASVPLDRVGCDALRTLLRGEGDAGGPALQRFVEELEPAIAATGFERVVHGGGKKSGEPLYVGHACISWSDGDLRVWTDPFFCPKAPRYPNHYQPLSPLDFPEERHVILITHTHADHFAPGCLFQFPADSIFIVPDVPEESLLSINVRRRLEQLEFHDVRTLQWGESLELGSFEITALPFYGEQPLGWGSEAGLSDFNRGNVYALRAGGSTSLLLADSGSDPRMSIEEYTRALRREVGRVDYFFANHRRWNLYPPQFLPSSVPQYLCFVPDEELARQQRLMLEPQEFLRAAEVLEARYAIPYAMGGAHWFEERGLGFDPLKKQQRPTDFDADTRELLNSAPPELGLTSDFELRFLLAGQHLTENGTLEWREGLRQPSTSDAFRPAGRSSDPECFAFSGPGLDAELLGDLASLTTLDTGAFLVAGPGFSELYTSPSGKGDFLREMLARLLEGASVTVVRSRPALSAAPFGTDKDWYSLFRRLHLQTFVRMREGDVVAGHLRRIARRPPFRDLPYELSDGIGRLLAERPPAQPHTPQGPGLPPEQTKRWKQIPIPWPSRADALRERFEPVEMTLALVLGKLIHNSYIGCLTLGTAIDAEDEGAWFDSILSQDKA
ncbi:MAG: MBL fold metallo-hydrolase [bacterium]|nr:MBL fold metallo-hydrolase [bacterium]